MRTARAQPLCARRRRGALGRAWIVPVLGSKTLRLGRRAFLMLSVAGFLPRLAQAQHTGIRHRIGWISTEPEPDPFLEGFREGLRRHGYVEGQNILLELRYAPGNIEALRSDVSSLPGTVESRLHRRERTRDP